MEQADVFKHLLNDVLKHLQTSKIIPLKSNSGNIILAGHSGAYRVIAYMLQNVAVDVKEVDFFDTLYSETDKFMQWIKKTRQIDSFIFTPIPEAARMRFR